MPTAILIFVIGFAINWIGFAVVFTVAQGDLEIMMIILGFLWAIFWPITNAGVAIYLVCTAALEVVHWIKSATA